MSVTCNSEKLALQRRLLVCLGSACKTNSTLKVPMSLSILCVGPAPRADRRVAPVMAQQWEAAQLWMGSGDGSGGVWGKLHHLDQVNSVKSASTLGLGGAQRWPSAHTSLSGDKKCEVLRVWGEVRGFTALIS